MLWRAMLVTPCHAPALHTHTHTHTAGEHCGFVKAWKKMEEAIGRDAMALTLDKPLGECPWCWRVLRVAAAGDTRARQQPAHDSF
jgi:hypothetical protein